VGDFLLLPFFSPIVFLTPDVYTHVARIQTINAIRSCFSPPSPSTSCCLKAGLKTEVFQSTFVVRFGHIR